MTAQPGWYEAGIPGRERWWDGMQWTAHERDASTAASFASSAPAPGWYPMPGSDELRWWEGRWWTLFRIRAGRPGTDAFGTDQPGTATSLGVVFLLLGVAQLALSMSTGSVGSGIPFLVLGVLWIISGAQASALRRKPAPLVAAVFPEAVGPFPGQQDGLGAGWYRVHRRASRWWTGTRWAPYVHLDRVNGIRPSYYGRRVVLTTRIVVGALLGLGVLGLIGAIVLMVVGAASSDPSTMTMLTVIGVTSLLFSVVFVAGGIFLLLQARTQARILLIPKEPASAFPLA